MLLKGENKVSTAPITHCQNKRCGAQLSFRRPSERGRKKYCSQKCNGEVKHGPVVRGVTEQARERIEEIRWISDSDNPESIAKRVGYSSVDSMLRTLNRAGEYELARKLLAEHSRYLAAVEGDRDDRQA